MPNLRLLKFLLVLSFPVLLTACAGAVVGAGASAGVAAAEERGIAGAVDDLKIRAEINRVWFLHSEEMYRQVGLNIQEGRVLLTGTVAKPEHRIDAVRLVWQVIGVKEVLNEIQVVDQTGFLDYAQDVKIAAELRAKLVFDRRILSINYNVEVVNATVYLLGIAQDEAEMDRALGHARNIANVRRVVNYVRTRDDPRRKDS